MARVATLPRNQAQTRPRAWVTALVVLLILALIAGLTVLLLSFMGVKPPAALAGLVPGGTKSSGTAGQVTSELATLRAAQAALEAQRTQLETQLQEKEAQVQMLTAQVNKLQADLAAAEKKNTDQKAVAGIYASMQPKDAAQILTELPDAQVVPILAQLKNDQAAAILAAMDSKRAARLTQALGG